MFVKAKSFVAAVGVSLFAFAATPASAFVVNGDFEASVGLSGNSWDVFDSIDGWTKTAGTSGIEVQRGNIGGATPFDTQKVELDSHGGTNTNSGMYQDIALTAGTYELSFEYFAREATDTDGTNGIGFSIIPVGIDDGHVTGTSGDGWRTITDSFFVNSDQVVRLTFWATGKDNTLGGYLDNVQISAVPLPSSVLLFGAALVGLGWLGRKKKALA